MSNPIVSGAATASGLRRRLLLTAATAIGILLLAASAVYACTTYWGQTTIENITTDSGEFTVVADPRSGMDRCDDADDDGEQDGEYDSSKSGADEDEVIDFSNGDTLRVEISKWEPGGEDSGNDCGAEDNGGSHSLADNTGDGDDLWVNTYDGEAYDDTNGDDDGAYEDSDDGPGKNHNAGDETNGDPSSERVGDCMGDGSGDNVENHASGIAITSEGQFDTTDDDQDGVNDVDISPNFDGTHNSGTAAAVCVSEQDEGDSAPQIPLEVF